MTSRQINLLNKTYDWHYNWLRICEDIAEGCSVKERQKGKWVDTTKKFLDGTRFEYLTSGFINAQYRIVLKDEVLLIKQFGSTTNIPFMGYCIEALKSLDLLILNPNAIMQLKWGNDTEYYPYIVKNPYRYFIPSEEYMKLRIPSSEWIITVKPEPNKRMTVSFALPYNEKVYGNEKKTVKNKKKP